MSFLVKTLIKLVAAGLASTSMVGSGVGIGIIFAGFFNCIFMTNKNLLIFLIASEFMFLGIDLLYTGSALLLNDKSCLLYAVLILMLTVGESVAWLGLCVLSLKQKNSIPIIVFYILKIKC